MSNCDDEPLQEFQEALMKATQMFAFLSNDETFQKVNGFSMTEFLDLRRSCAKEIREVADSIECLVRDTGIARTTGGAVGVVSAVAAIGGLIAAPFTAGASLALTVGGVAGGIASAGTTLTAAIIKDSKSNEKAKEVKQLLESLKVKDEVVCKIVKELQKVVEKMQSLYEKKSVKDFLKDSMKIGTWIEKIGYNIAYKGYTVYSSATAIKFASAIAEFVGADFAAMRGVAVGMSAPGLTIPIWGRVVISAGSTSAKVMTTTFGVFGIGFGIWDMWKGAKDINGSKHAEAYRKAADDLDQNTETYAELLKKIKI